jgi:hypothetical protein
MLSDDVMPETSAKPLTFSTISVAVICTSGTPDLTRCLEALRTQRDAPDFEVVAVCDPKITGIERVRQRFPEARILANQGQRTPLELGSRAVRECRGELILFTKDQCVPNPNWVRTMVDAQQEGRAAVGGRVEIAPDASPTDWAFYFVDYFRYAGPVEAGSAPFLTVCNVVYKRSELEAIRPVWDDSFVETAVNEALRARFGTLWIHPGSEVTIYRHVTLRTAVTERYAFGRLFGWSRIATWSSGRRLLYALFAPALPLLLLGRMVTVALRSRRLAGALVRSLLPLTLIVLARSWGEWLAYLTGRLPRSLVDASAASDVRRTV